MANSDIPRNGYDAFISHNHADKEWVRQVASRLAEVDFNGRPLRPWLDEKILDPGELGGEAELTSALDRSRFLVIVLSPASIASKWVEFELQYFLEHRGVEEVVPIIKAPCVVPAQLSGAKPLDFSSSDDLEECLSKLVERLCPAGGLEVDAAKSIVDESWEIMLASDPGGFDAEPTPERDAVLAALLRFDIDDPQEEGLALTAFARAGTLALRDNERGHPAAYNATMLLGECLAVAIARSSRFRQVAQRYLDLEDPATEDPVLGFVVVRAYSKLAELDPALIDLGVLLRVAVQLDAAPPWSNKKDSVAMLVGRVAAKLRGTDAGDLLIKALSEGGAAGRTAAIGGISMAEQPASTIFYVSELAAFHKGHPAPSSTGASQPPSSELLALLFGIDLDQPQTVWQHLAVAKDDLKRFFDIDDLPYGYSWDALRNQPPAAHLHKTPFLGSVARATVSNMEALAMKIDASHVVCLTEPRIVDALFDRAGALLIPLQNEDSPQCRRLAGRAVPFAMLDENQMAELKDGDHIEVEAGLMRVVSDT